jgi:hypothetical protein
MKKLNVGRFVVAGLAVVVAAWFLEWLIHAVFLRTVFYSGVTLWRSYAEMLPKSMFAAGASLAVFAFTFAWIFHLVCKGRRFEGLLYGFYIWLLVTVSQTLMQYAFQPVGDVALWWIVFGLPEMLVLGLVVDAIYKPR